MIKNLVSSMLAWNRSQKSFFIILFDSLIVVFASWLPFVLFKEILEKPELYSGFFFLIGPILAIPCFILFDLHKSVIRFISFMEIWGIVKATIIYSLLWAFFTTFLVNNFLPISFHFVHALLVLLLVASSRMIGIWIFTDSFSASNVIIYGAGSAGIQLATALRYSREMTPIAFVDEDKSLQGNYLNGLSVFSPSRLERLISKKKVNEVLIAIPSARKAKLQDILSKIEGFPVKVRILPGVAELAQGKVSVSDLKVIDVTDLLGREITKPNEDLLQKNIYGKNVLVSGAGGSIGSELCRQVIKAEPSILVLYEISEYALYKIEKELSKSSPQTEVKPILGNVIDKKRMLEVCTTFDIDTIYHAAAYKHVPMVELNTLQSLQNNIFGTLNCVEVAIESEVETFVLISTDKAVRPTNIMGATKRFAELILQSLAQRQISSQSKTNTRIAIVRFGNVLDSSGSAVPLFREQIEKGGPITVTDPEVIRYFMSIPEAAELVIQAGAMGEGGEIFVLDMGDPVKILDLAKRMVRLSGLEVRDNSNPEGDIEIVFTGLRDGEKLYEELLIGDNVSSTEHKGIMQASEEYLEWEKVEGLLEQLRTSIEKRDHELAVNILINNIAGLKLNTGINDLIYLSNTKK
ncbi:MAG: nucleoside-diphosphate sugar epimerase/dehydratase [Pseudomonadota bacterium]|nr:nucleoside-diphosphate sugar epimerase/dehydratase [Pseudomonadota bacterium]